MPTREDLIKRAREYVGVPYRHQGRSADIGVDCIGLPICAFHKDHGLGDYDTTEYTRRPNAQTFKQGAINAGYLPIPLNDAKTADLLHMAMPRWPVHCGVLDIDETGKKWVIHAYMPMKMVVREPYEKVLKNIVGAWRHKDLN